jgi:opacity protein-like surface antigen
MKTLLALAVALLALAVRAEDPPLLTDPQPPAPTKPKPSNWWTDFSISPYAAIKHPDFGKPIWGGGLDIGYAINRTVSLHLGNSIFDRPDIKGDKHESGNVDEGGWFTGSAIDETELLFRADLIKGGGAGRDRFVGFLLGSGTRDWEREDWGFGVGAGAELRLSKNFSLGADSRLRAFFNNDKDLLTRGFLSLKF